MLTVGFVLVLGCRGKENKRGVVVSSFLGVLLSNKLAVFIVIVVLTVLVTSCGGTDPGRILVVANKYLKGGKPCLVRSPRARAHIGIIGNKNTFIVPFVRRTRFRALSAFGISISIRSVVAVSTIPISTSTGTLLHINSAPRLVTGTTRGALKLDRRRHRDRVVRIIHNNIHRILSKLAPGRTGSHTRFRGRIERDVRRAFTGLKLRVATLRVAGVDSGGNCCRSLDTGRVTSGHSCTHRTGTRTRGRTRLIRIGGGRRTRRTRLRSGHCVSSGAGRASITVTRGSTRIRARGTGTRRTCTVRGTVRRRALGRGRVIIHRGRLGSAMVTRRGTRTRTIRVGTRTSTGTLHVGTRTSGSTRGLDASTGTCSVHRRNRTDTSGVRIRNRTGTGTRRTVTGTLRRGKRITLTVTVVSGLPRVSTSCTRTITDVSRLAIFSNTTKISNRAGRNLTRSLTFVGSTANVSITRLIGGQTSNVAALGHPIPIRRSGWRGSTVHTYFTTQVFYHIFFLTGYETHLCPIFSARGSVGLFSSANLGTRLF